MSGFVLVRSRRKTLAIHVKPDGAIEVRAPLRLAKSEIDRFVAAKSDWIEKTRNQVAERQNATLRPLPPLVFEKEEFLRVVHILVNQWERRLDVKASFVGLRAMTSRWGSCTPKSQRIRLNTSLAYCPQECIEYVVVHELAHLRENNHSQRFWAIVSDALPDYKGRKKTLKWLGWILKGIRGNEHDREESTENL